MAMPADKRYKHELVDPELLEVRSQLITLLQNALRRDTYIGLDTIGLIGEAIAVEAKFTIWFLNNVSDENRYMEILTQLEEPDRVVVDAARTLREDHQNLPFQTALRELIERLTKMMQ